MIFGFTMVVLDQAIDQDMIHRQGADGMRMKLHAYQIWKEFGPESFLCLS